VPTINDKTAFEKGLETELDLKFISALVPVEGKLCLFDVKMAEILGFGTHWKC
jgi:hypothetical protein